MDSRQKVTSSVNKEYMDQRVRGHDFLAYFRSHLTTICLVFWFLTISVSVAATAIYLIKKLEIESKKPNAEGSTEKNNAVKEDGGDRADKEEDYVDVDVVGFLIDTFYNDGQGTFEDRAEDAGLNSTSTNYTVPESDENTSTYYDFD